MFYKRYVDDILNKRKKNEPDQLLEKLQSFHPKIKFTVEVSPEKFLDTSMVFSDGLCETKVYRKPNKVPLHWLSKTPIRYKRNAIIGDLNRARRMSSFFKEEVETIREKFSLAGFPPKFVDSVIGNFINPRPAGIDDLPMIPPYYFDSPPPFS